MIAVDYELGKKIVETNTCECGAGLTLAWGGFWGIKSYVLKCIKDPSHNRIARPAELGPYDIPGWNLFNLKGRRREMEERLGKEKATKLMKYEGVVSLTRAEAMEVLKTIWPKAPEVEVLKAAMICHQYGLNPLMKHVFLIPFKRRERGVVVGEDWVTVLGINSNRLNSQRRHHYSYLDLTPRRMNDQEQEKILGEVDDSKIWAITKLKDMKTGAEVMGIGSWPKDETPYGADKGNTKLNMACVRSERQALDRQYPGEMPQGVEVIDEQYTEIIEGEGKTLPSMTGGEEKTGEVAVKKLGEGKVGATDLSSPKAENEAGKTKKNSDAPPAEPTEGKGFSIDPTWLKESLTALKWDDETCKTFLASQYNVSPQGSLEEVIKRLTREQAEVFTKEITNKLSQIQMGLFQ